MAAVPLNRRWISIWRPVYHNQGETALFADEQVGESERDTTERHVILPFILRSFPPSFSSGSFFQLYLPCLSSLSLSLLFSFSPSLLDSLARSQYHSLLGISSVILLSPLPLLFRSHSDIFKLQQNRNPSGQSLKCWEQRHMLKLFPSLRVERRSTRLRHFFEKCQQSKSPTLIKKNPVIFWDIRKTPEQATWAYSGLH